MNSLKHKAIQVNIDCDIATKEVCKIVVETLLKYILYQFQQIPVQIDVLEKELAKGEYTPELSELFKNDNQLTEDCKVSTDPRSYFKQKGLQKRTELANRMRARRRKMWLMKVEKLINNFKSTIKILENVFNNGVVNTIIFSVGTTPLTPKFIFKLHIPLHPSGNHSSSEVTSSSALKRKILLNMLRAFANNAEILKFTSSNFSASKLWTFFEKEDLSKVEEYQSSADVILRPEFSISPRTRCIDVNLNEKNIINMAMELTPCVNGYNRKSFISSILGSRRNSVINGNVLEEEKIDSDDLDLDFKPLEYDDNPQDKEEVDSIFTKPPSLNKVNTLNGVAVKCCAIHTPFRHKEDRKDRGSTTLTKTPHHESNNDYYTMVETPVISSTVSTPSPVKRLTRGITELKFTPTKNEDHQTRDLNWYQIDFSLNGFKDMC